MSRGYADGFDAGDFGELPDAAETRAEIRDEAVKHVDARYGYTMEFSAFPEGHRGEYDLEEDQLLEAAGLGAES